MISSVDSAVIDKEVDLTLVETIWHHIQQRLEVQKARILAEMEQYPYPISACDAQYNGLLEERATILHEIGQTKSARKQKLTFPEHMALLKKFLESSRHLDHEAKVMIQQVVTQ